MTSLQRWVLPPSQREVKITSNTYSIQPFVNTEEPSPCPRPHTVKADSPNYASFFSPCFCLYNYGFVISTLTQVCFTTRAPRSHCPRVPTIVQTGSLCGAAVLEDSPVTCALHRTGIGLVKRRPTPTREPNFLTKTFCFLFQKHSARLNVLE